MPSSLNGTGVTFNDATTLNSGAIPAANLGTGSPTGSTFLRGDRSWQTPSTSPTSAQILTAFGGAAFGAVGSYCYSWPFGSAVALGGTASGSSLPFVDSGGSIVTSQVSGTWRNMGDRDSFSGSIFWLRIS
jgi:hypothetical protein